MANDKVSAQFLYNIRKKYANDPIRQVYEAAKYGDADLLNEVLGQMSDSERTSALEAKTTSKWSGKFDELKDAFTPLIVAAEKGNVDCMKVLLSYNADVNCGGDLFNPSKINARPTENCTPLMIASWSGHVNVVNFLVKHGAYVDLQDKNGDTALHYAVHRNSLEVTNKLLSLGASQLHNKRRFTPLLFASNKAHMTAIVESLINRPECTKEQRIDALELHGASLAIAQPGNTRGKAFYYLKRGMEERFHDPSHPVLKQPMEPVEAYQNRKESQTLEELVQIEGDLDAIIMESLIVKERILGTDNQGLLGPIKKVACIYEESGRFDICIGLLMHAMEIGQHCNQSVLWDIYELIKLLYTMIQNNFSPRQEVVLEVIQKTALECEKLVEKIKLADELEREYSVESRRKFKESKDSLDYFLLRLLQILAHTELCDEDENMCMPVLLQKLKFCLNTQDDQGNTLLHMATKRQKKFEFHSNYSYGTRKAPFEFPCAKTIKLLLNGGINVNVINNNGDTPLHTAVTFNPTEDDDDFNYVCYDDDDDDDDDDNDYPYERDRIRHLTDTLEVLLDGGAHIDFVNNDGKTAMDTAVTDEARGILSERKTLELKSIAARAVKKLGLPYLGLVPKTLEKFISMH